VGETTPKFLFSTPPPLPLLPHDRKFGTLPPKKIIVTASKSFPPIDILGKIRLFLLLFKLLSQSFSSHIFYHPITLF
jgi:hypothetical protein